MGNFLNRFVSAEIFTLGFTFLMGCGNILPKPSNGANRRTKMETNAKRPEVLNIGVTSKGNSVIRLMMPNGSIREVDTNLKSFAFLAAAGVPVKNE